MATTGNTLGFLKCAGAPAGVNRVAYFERSSVRLVGCGVYDVLCGVCCILNQQSERHVEIVVTVFGRPCQLPETFFRTCLGDEGLSDLHCFLLVIDGIDWTQIPLVQCDRACCQTSCYPGQTGPIGDFD